MNLRIERIATSGGVSVTFRGAGHHIERGSDRTSGLVAAERPWSWPAVPRQDTVAPETPAEPTETLFDKACARLRLARTAQREGDWAVARAALDGAREIVRVLRPYLDPGLYGYVHDRLGHGAAVRDIAATREALEMLDPLRTAYRPVPA